MNLSGSRALFEQVGGFDERFIGYGGEDQEFGYRLCKNGYKLRYAEDALAFHLDDAGDIVAYGKKLYKAGLYGNRMLNRVCPEAQISYGWRNLIVRGILSKPGVKRMLELYLSKTDGNHWLYSYLLFKAYLYSCSYRGKCDQKKNRELTREDASCGW